MPGAVELARREQLLGADDAELGAELGTDQILPSFTAAEGQVGNLRAHAARQQHQQLGVFVIRMRADHQDTLVAAELAERAGQRRNAAGAGRRKLREAGPRGADTKEER